MDEVKAAANASAEKGAETAKIIKYKVVNKCWWNKILWREGSIVKLASNLTPPKEHFQKI